MPQEADGHDLVGGPPFLTTNRLVLGLNYDHI